MSEPGELVAESAPMRRLMREARRVAALDATVLIVGETGVGKGLLARELHRRSRRRDRPFVHPDCASLHAGLLESELFGHERGAFTGAAGRRIGRVERAADGTLFLDEIAELEAELQGRLLRLLQDREFERVGCSEPRHLRARVLAATQRDLHQDARRGRFRADLLYRLDVVRLVIPPLRDRRADLPRLVERGLARIARRHREPAPELDGSAHRALSAHAWPGNVRELENVLERLAVHFPGGRVAVGEVRQVLDPFPPDRADRVAEAVDPLDAARVSSALREAGGNVSAAARRLGVPRTTLRRRLLVLEQRSSAPAEHREPVPEQQA